MGTERKENQELPGSTKSTGVKKYQRGVNWDDRGRKGPRLKAGGSKSRGIARSEKYQNLISK